MFVNAHCKVGWRGYKLKYVFVVSTTNTIIVIDQQKYSSKEGS